MMMMMMVMTIIIIIIIIIDDEMEFVCTSSFSELFVALFYGSNFMQMILFIICLFVRWLIYDCFHSSCMHNEHAKVMLFAMSLRNGT